MSNNNYLRWEADGLKSLITQRLIEQGVFTDQIFQDSNLSTLIDVFSYMYETLQYNVNHSASEAMFTDAKLYENMNRIVKMLGYNPSGYTSVITNNIVLNNTGLPDSLLPNSIYLLPKYTSFRTDFTAKNGTSIYFSLVSQKSLVTDNTGALLDRKDEAIKFVNGQWVYYSSPFNATGLAFETFTMSDLFIKHTDETKITYISHPYIDVWVERNGQFIYFETISEGNIFSNKTKIFGPADKVCELRLNENYNYTLTFGDGLTGSRLLPNDILHVVYLKGNGKDVTIPNNIFNKTNPKPLSIGIVNSPSDFVSDISGELANKFPLDAQLKTLYTKNISDSSTFSDIENVEEIRSNAPDWFRSGQRLITKKDFESFLKNSQYNDTIQDVYCMNNWSYMVEFLAWLDLYVDSNGNTLLKSDIKEIGYEYADSCDFNNVYLWMKYKTQSVDPGVILEDLQSRKCLTSEPIIYDALPVYFVPCISGELTYNKIDIFDENVENFIEVKKAQNALITAEKLKDNVSQEITKFFDNSKVKIGQSIDIRKLTTNILSLDGVESIKTVFLKGSVRKEIDGLSFAVFTRKLISGQDVVLTNGLIKLRNFQYASLIEKESLQLEKRIKINYKAFASSTTEY